MLHFVDECEAKRGCGADLLFAVREVGLTRLSLSMISCFNFFCLSQVVLSGITASQIVVTTESALLDGGFPFGNPSTNSVSAAQHLDVLSWIAPTNYCLFAVLSRFSL